MSDTSVLTKHSNSQPVAIHQIVVVDRYRKDLGDLEPLKQSITEIGLLHPVVIDGDNRLLVGGRRLEACKQLGMLTIPAVTAVSLSELRQRVLAERDENVCREPFKPSEMVAVGKKIEEFQRPIAEAAKAEGGGRGGKAKDRGNSPILEKPQDESKRTSSVAAAACGVDRRTYEKAKAVDEAARSEPERYGHLVDEMDRTGKVSRAYSELRKAKRKDAESETLAAIQQSGGLIFDMRQGDFQSVLADVAGGSIDLVLTDPPYGDSATKLYGDLALWAADKLKPGGSLVAYCGQATLGEVIAAMSPHLKYWWCFALTHSAMPQQLPGKWVQVRWKPIVWFVNQRRSTKHYIDDVIVGTPPRKDLHEWAQGLGEVKPIIESLTEAGEMVVDPFAGSGSFGRAANECGRHFIGSDNGSHQDGKR